MCRSTDRGRCEGMTSSTSATRNYFSIGSMQPQKDGWWVFSKWIGIRSRISPAIYSYQKGWVETTPTLSFCPMSTGTQTPGLKLQEHHPLLWSEGTVSRSDERMNEAGFKVSGQACGSGRGNASVPMNTSSLSVPRPSHFLVSHPISQVVEMSEKFFSRLGRISE